jgi:hypothetical protein
MPRLVIPFSGFIVFAAAIIASAQPPPAEPSGPPPPPSPHWYQHVARGVTVTNLTPIAYFRGLLGMTPEERERVLADKTPKEREHVLAKIDEYENLPREIREERLRHTELHWHLLTLLRLSPAQRQERMKEISPLYAPMLSQQLALWDRLPGDTRKALLDNEHFLQTYAQLQEVSATPPNEAPDKIPAEQRARWKAELNRWQALPESRRRELCDAFRQFFYSTGEQQKATIKGLSPDEQRQMAQTLSSYASLSPAAQRDCVESFGKFAMMSTGDREQFLHNAAKWEAMSEHEREVWRSLVNQLQPMPPWPGPPMPSAASGNGSVTNMASAVPPSPK